MLCERVCQCICRKFQPMSGDTVAVQAYQGHYFLRFGRFSPCGGIHLDIAIVYIK